jgi:hypothetical protein
LQTHSNNGSEEVGKIDMKKVIYDFGSNNGDDIPYYLKKSDLVVAVEADPLLCDHIKTRFSNEINQKN